MRFDRKPPLRPIPWHTIHRPVGLAKVDSSRPCELRPHTVEFIASGTAPGTCENIEMTEFAGPGRDISVFVHLAHGFGRGAWKARMDAGSILGINHDDPYGYRQANDMGCIISQSEDRPERLPGRLIRLGLRKILGFDLLHAWRNRHGILSSEVVWTHTESQSLAVLALFRIFGRTKKTRLIAQTIWLADDWNSYSAPRRSLYRGLLRRADVLTVHSNSALREMKRIFPDTRSELVRYGIRADQAFDRPFRPMNHPIRVLALGNDRHRDWPTLVAALRGCAVMEARIITRADVARLVAGIENVTVAQPANNRALKEMYSWADVVVVPLTENLHASGITVIQEAVLFGVPVVCSDCGDLRSYFPAEELQYVAPHDPEALRDAILQCGNDDKGTEERAKRALDRMKHGNINSYSFVEQHVKLSRELLHLPFDKR